MRSKFLWLLKSVAALFCALLFWEIALRGVIIRPVAYGADAKLGWLPQSHARGLHSGEGFSALNYNALGFRDREIEAKSGGKIRILALGDSFTEGRQVDEQSTFSARLNRALNDCGNVRVINGGRDGVSPAMSLYLANDYRRLFAPDWVVFLIHDRNWQQVFSRDEEVFYRPEGDGFRFALNWQGERLSRLRVLTEKTGLNSSAAYTYAKTRYSLLQGAPILGQIQAAAPADEIARQNRALNWTMVRLQEKFPHLVVVHMPMGSAEQGGLLSPDAREMELERVCATQKIPFIAMRAVIENDFVVSRRPPVGFSNSLPWTGHANGHGHQLIARELEKFFRPRVCAPLETAKNAPNFR